MSGPIITMDPNGFDLDAWLEFAFDLDAWLDTHDDEPAREELGIARR